MRPLQSLLTELRECQVRLWLDDGQLRFEAPKGALSGTLMAEVRERKVEVVAFLRARGRAAAPTRVPPVMRVEGLTTAPLSYAQQRLWFLYQYEGPTPTYNILIACRTHGELNVAALATSFNDLRRRHFGLRTTFGDGDGGPQQIVQETRDLAIRRHDLSDMDTAARADALARLKAEEARRTFDLGTGPLLAITLVKERADQHVLIMVMHHIIGDGWSLGTLTRELTAIYAARLAGSMPNLPPCLQYVDYAHWQRNVVPEDVFAPAIERWKTILDASPPRLDIFAGIERPATHGHDGKTENLLLPTAVVERLMARCRREGVSMFMMVATLFKVLLLRYAGQTDLMVGTQVANRGRPELESIVGFFINTIVIRTRLDGRPTFSECLARVKSACVEAFELQDVPFERLVEALQPERDPGANPIVQLMVLWQNAPMGELALAGIELTPEPIKSVAAKFDLTLDMMETARGIEGVLEYRTDLFTSGMMRRMVAHLTALAGRVADGFNEPVTSFDLVEPSPPVDYALPTETILSRFRDVVMRAPQAVAVRDLGAELTYAELDRRSNQAAHALIRHGVGVEDCVGFCMGRTVDSIVTMLGILKAGAAMVPLDAEHPAERRRRIAVDAGLGVLVVDTTSDIELDSVAVVDFTDLAIGAESGEAPGRIVFPSGLAYVIFTSGSTGVPKGVMVGHASVVNLVDGLRDAVYTAQEESVNVALLAPYVFDASIQQLFGALLQGHALCLIEASLRHDPAALAARFVAWNIELADCTPSLLAVMAAGGFFAEPRLPLRHLLCGGEALPWPLLRQVEAAGGGRITINNVYGPTECCVDVTHYRVPSGFSNMGGTVPLGHAFGGVELVVLDGEGMVQPVGIAGELHIGGVALARGYAGAAGRTAERFVPHPHAPGRRLYRTGDVAYVDEQGLLRFLGRNDDQVKVRGYRIELGEVEAALAGLDEVEQAAVIVDDAAAELLAYVVVSPRLDVVRIRAALARRLPAYMIPARFYEVAALPLTASGKVDRAALRGHGGVAAMDSGVGYVAPRSDVETDLVEVWREILGIDSIGIRDNYFASGGDSIKALQLVSRLRARKRTMRVRDLFEHPTIEALAPYLKRIESAANMPRDTQGEAPLLPIQRDFLCGHGGDTSHYCQAILLHPTQPIDAAALRAALPRVVALHDGFRLRFAQEGKGWRQWYSDEGSHVSFETVRLTGDFAAALTRHATTVHASMDLGRGPLFKVVLYEGDGGQRLLLTAHHLVIDAHSWRIVMDDLALVMEGEAPPQEPCSYKDWCLILARYGEQMPLAEREYWRSWDGRAIPPLALSPPATGRYRDLNTVSMRLDADRTRRLLTRCHTAYRTEINDLLLAALCRAVSAWSGQPRVALCLEGHGREDLPDGLDHSRTTGWFTTTYPVEFNVGATTLGRCIKEVKETLRAVPGKGLGFGLWKQGAGVAATAIGRPEMRFNYLGHFGGAAPGVFHLASEDPGVVIDPDGLPGFEIEWVGLVERDVLEFTAAYNRHRFDATAMVSLAERFEAELIAVIDHTSGLMRAELTPSDIDYDGFDITRLDDFMSRDMLPVAVQNIYPLAPLQEGLFFHWLRDPDASAYAQQLCYTVRGDFDLALYEAAWRRVIARHDVLRTVFIHNHTDRPLQVVAGEQDFTLTRVDLSGETPHAQAVRRREFKDQDRAQGVDLAVGPNMRVGVLKLGARLHEIVWSHHHILLDGWSLGVLQRELTQVMAALVAGREPDLEPPVPFALYIRHAEAQDRERAIAYWAQTLSDLTRPTGLPAHGREFTGASPRQRRSGAWPGAVAASLRAMAQREQVTLNTVLHALWSILLARYNGTPNVCFGMAVSGRPGDIAGIERMVGLCVNTVPVAVRVAGTARELLHAIQEAALSAEAYHLTPLARIQAQTAWRDGLMPTHVTLENFPLDEQFKRVDTVTRDGLQVVAAEIAEETHYPLDIQFLPDGDTLAYRLAYDPDVYDGLQVERTMDQFVYLAGHFHAHLDDDVVSLDLEPLQVPATQSDIPHFDPRETLVSLFTRTVAEFPDAVAISLDGREMRYRDLDAHANRLANWLIEKGVGRGDLVALAMDRGEAALVALLGIVKCGAAYLPIDLFAPPARMAYMIRDAKAALLLTEPKPPAAVSQLPIERIEIALDTDDWLSRSTTPPNVAIFPDQLAYVIYTSGSTGEPKGVAIAHRQVVRLFAHTQAWYAFGAADVWTWFHSAAFDFSVWEIWGAWLHGGRLVVVPYWVSRSPEDFYRLLSRQRVTVLNQTPSAFYPLMGVDAEHRLSLALRYVIFGGEALNVPALREWFSHHSDVAPRLVNMYGITETTVHVSYRPVRHEDLLSPASVIGEPILDQSIQVLDAAMKPVAVGVPGELYVGGAGGARGYLGRPGLTAERFVPDPFAAEPGARLYRTGDLARRLANGDLEYLGRCDHQVQLHGFRIELGEVEAVLRQAAGVAQVAVLIRDAQGQSAQLAAFVVVVVDAGASASVTAWRAHCANFLPAYMIPSSFVALEALPLTANGKLDHTALLALRDADDAPPEERVAPRNEIERVLVEVWADVLGRKAVGVTDNYFALGGDSIRAIQIVSRLRSRDLQVAIRDLMQRQTIEALAPYVETVAPVAPVADEAQGAMPLTPIQRRFFETAGAFTAHFNHTILLKSTAPLDTVRMQSAFTALASHHAILRACFPQGASGREVLVRPADAVPVTVVTRDLRQSADPDAEQAAHADGVQRGFDLDAGLLWSVVIYRRDDADRLFIAMHHLLVDGVSWRILLDDLFTLYEALGAGRAAGPLARSASFAAWSRGLNAYAQSDTVRQQLPYWQAVAAVTSLPLPVDHGGGNRYGDAEIIRVRLDADRSRTLLHEAHAAYATTAEDLLVAALSATLREWLGGDGHVIAMEGHGREGVLDGVEFSRTIGWFTALYPYALDWNLERDLGYRVRQVKESLRRVPVRGIGYGLLRYLTRGIDAASLGADPSISFNYLGQFDTEADDGVLAIVREPVGEDVAAEGARPFELEFSAMVMGGRVECQLSFSRRRWQRASLEHVFNRYLAHLNEIVDHCRGRERQKLTPSDLSYSDLSIDELEDIFSD